MSSRKEAKTQLNSETSRKDAKTQLNPETRAKTQRRNCPQLIFEKVVLNGNILARSRHLVKNDQTFTLKWKRKKKMS